MAENDYVYDASNIDASPGGDSVKSSILEKNQARVEQIIDHLNTHKNRTATHGVVSAIVGTEDTQVLSNKTLVDPIVSYAGEPAQNAPVTREYVEGQSNLAVTQAGVARDEAVVARNEAVAARDIAVDAAAFLKISDTPILSGLGTENEGETLTITITNHEAVNKYLVSVSGGSATVVGGIISWILPNVDVDTSYSMTVFASKDGYQESKAAVHNVLVKYVPIQDGPTMVFSNTVDGWPGAIIDGDGIQPPAYSGGLVNEKQIVSGKMEVEVTSGKKTVLDGTTATLLKTLEAIETGDLLVTDKGESVAREVTETGVDPSTVVDILGDGSCRSFFPFNGTPNDLGPNAAHINAVGTYTAGKFGKAVTFPKGTDDMSVPFNSNSVSFSWYTKFTTNHFYSVFNTTAGNVGLNWTINKNNYHSYALGNNGYRPEYGDLSWMIDDGIFHHVVMTFSPTETKLYVDKTLYYTLPYTPIGTAHTMKQSSIMVAEPLDNLRVFNKALTDSDVATVYAGAVEYSVAVNLPTAPTKVFKNPLQGETLNVGSGTTATSLKINQPVSEGDSLFLDGVAGVAGG